MSKIIIPGEPKVVTEDRELILETFKDLVFIEDGHKYFRDGKELPSVSEVTHKFKPEFDTDGTAIGYAKKNGKTPEFWKSQWKFKNLKATISGTLVHEYGEGLFWLGMGYPERIPDSSKMKYIKDERWLIPTRPKEEAVLMFHKEMNPYDFPVLAETRVYNNFKDGVQKMGTSYCGTFDILYYRYFPDKPEDSGYVIKDYKGLDINTKLYTQNRGWITMNEVGIGDILYDRNYTWTKVIGVSGIHQKPCYKIKFSGGQEVIADFDHRWEIKGIDGKYKILTSEDIYRERDNLMFLPDLTRSIYISDIFPVESIPTKCIEVDSPSRTYRFGEDLLCTHNTNKELESKYAREKKKFCLPPFNDLYDESLSMYTLQLSCYQIPLEDLGLKVIDREIIWLKDTGEYELIKLPDITQKLREKL